MGENESLHVPLFVSNNVVAAQSDCREHSDCRWEAAVLQRELEVGFAHCWSGVCMHLSGGRK
jgi:hypothetical protein